MLRMASTHVRLWNLDSSNKDQEKLQDLYCGSNLSQK